MKTTKLTILQINDTHGYLEPHSELFWQGDKAEYRISGGYARLLTIFKQVRREQNGAVIALDNGDTFHQPTKILEQDVTDAQIRLHHLRTIELPERASKS